MGWLLIANIFIPNGTDNNIKSGQKFQTNFTLKNLHNYYIFKQITEKNFKPRTQKNR